MSSYPTHLIYRLASYIILNVGDLYNWNSSYVIYENVKL